jgi:hypothetical protein
VTRYTRLKARVVAHQAEGREVCLYSGCERPPWEGVDEHDRPVATLMCEHHTRDARRRRSESKKRRKRYREVQVAIWRTM